MARIGLGDIMTTENRGMKGGAGFTLIELMIVVAIIGILASIAIAAYQTYTIRSQVTDGIFLAASAKTPIVEAFMSLGEVPTNRAQAGMTPNATDTQGNYVQSVAITDGRVNVTFGNRAHGAIAGLLLYLTPYETGDLSVVWRCGNAPAPVGLAPMGTSGGGNAATFLATTVPNQYLPGTCRP